MAEGTDNVMWGPILEKAYAKFAGSYEKISTGGVVSEAIRSLTNMPGFVYPTAQAKEPFEKIQTALSQGDVVTCSSPVHKNSKANAVLNIYGINLAHAYALLGAVELQGQVGEEDGNPVYGVTE